MKKTFNPFPLDSDFYICMYLIKCISTGQKIDVKELISGFKLVVVFRHVVTFLNVEGPYKWARGQTWGGGRPYVYYALTLI